jgi:hypothetical protein
MAIPKVVVGQAIRCSAIFRDGNNSPVDPDNYSPLHLSGSEPEVFIYDSSENLLLSVLASAVVRDSIGFFYYDYTVATTATLGTYRVRWSATIQDVPIVYDDYFQVTATPTISSETLIIRIQRELKDLAEELDDAEYQDVQLDAEADVMDVSSYGLSWHNKWEILWLTKRGVRHSLQRILNNWLTKFTLGKMGKSLSLSDPARAIMQRITMIDTEFEKAKETRWFDGVHWVYRAATSAITSAQQVMGYDVDQYTGTDRTPRYDSFGNLHYPFGDDDDPWIN